MLDLDSGITLETSTTSNMKPGVKPNLKVDVGTTRSIKALNFI